MSEMNDVVYEKNVALFELFTLFSIRGLNGPKLSPVNQAVANDYYRFGLHHKLENSFQMLQLYGAFNDFQLYFNIFCFE